MESTPYPNIRRASRALSLAFPDVDEEERQNQAYLVSVRRRTIQDAMAYLKRKSQDATPSATATATAARNTAAAAAPSHTPTTSNSSGSGNNVPQSGANTHLSEDSTRRQDTCHVASDTIGSHIGQSAMLNHGAKDATPLNAAAEKSNRNTPLTETSRPQQPSSTSHTTTTTTTNASPMVHYLYGDNAENIEKDVFSKPGQVIVFTTSMTGERSVRDQSRALETLLYIKQIPYHYMDVADNACLQRLVREIYLTAMRKAAQKEKQQQQQEGDNIVPNHSMTSNHSNSTMGSRSTQATLTHSLQRQHLSRHHIPLPLLCVNKHLIGTYTTVQELEDDGMLVKKLIAKGYQPRSQPPPPPPPERPAPLLDGAKDTPLGNKEEEEEEEESSSMRPLSSSSTQSTKEITANTKAIASDKEGKVSGTVDGAKECKPHTKSPTPPPSRSYRGAMATNHATLNSISHTPTIQPPQQPRLGTQIDRHSSSRAAGILLPPSSSSPSSSLSMRNQHPYRGTYHTTAAGAKDTRDLPNISTTTTNSNTAALLEKSATGMLPGTMVNVSLPCGEQNKLSLDSAETPRDEAMATVAKTSSIIPHNSKVHIPHDSYTHHTAHENKSNNTTTTNTTMTSVSDSIALPHPPRQPIYTSEELMRPFAKRSVITDTSSSSQPRTMTNSSMVTQGVHVPHSPAPSPDNVLLHFSHTQSPSLPRHMNTLLPVKSSRQMSDGFVNHSHHLYT